MRAEFAAHFLFFALQASRKSNMIGEKRNSRREVSRGYPLRPQQQVQAIPRDAREASRAGLLLPRSSLAPDQIYGHPRGVPGPPGLVGIPNNEQGDLLLKPDNHCQEDQLPDPHNPIPISIVIRPPEPGQPERE